MTAVPVTAAGHEVRGAAQERVTGTLTSRGGTGRTATGVVFEADGTVPLLFSNRTALIVPTRASSAERRTSAVHKACLMRVGKRRNRVMITPPQAAWDDGITSDRHTAGVIST
jgi:hypothetical protein